MCGLCSHDLSTPLTSVKGYASGILDGIARTEEQRHHYIEMIYQKAWSVYCIPIFLAAVPELKTIFFRSGSWF